MLFLDSIVLNDDINKFIYSRYNKIINNEEEAIANGYKKIYNCGIEIYGINKF